MNKELKEKKQTFRLCSRRKLACPGGQAGQALMELLIGVGIGAIILGSVVGIARVSIQSNAIITKSRAAADLAKEVSDFVKVYAELNWKGLYELNKGSGNHYYIPAISPFLPVVGDETVEQNDINYTRYFYVENVFRSNTDDSIVSSGGTNDPLTQKVTAVVEWESIGSFTLTEYLAQNRNFTFQQSDWSQGVGQDGPLSIPGSVFSSSSNVSTTTVGSLTLTSTNGSGYLISSIFDTGFATSVPNTMIWQGVQPTGTSVSFQLATSASSDGPWSYIGSDGTGVSFYSPSGPGEQVKIIGTNHLFHRYIRYKVWLYPDGGQAETPRVDDIVINYSR